MNITEKQNQTLVFIRGFIEQYGYGPSMRDIAEHFGVSVKCAFDRIEALEKHGKIKRNRKIARSIQIL